MGHRLATLPDKHPFGKMLFQCLKCGCTFDVEGANVADFVLSCRLEQALRETNEKVRKERPILAKDTTREKEKHPRGRL
jgi:hypothetical protein